MGAAATKGGRELAGFKRPPAWKGKLCGVCVGPLDTERLSLRRASRWPIALRMRARWSQTARKSTS